MWPFKKAVVEDSQFPDPRPCNWRWVSYTWSSSDGSSGDGSITMQSNPGVDGDQLKKSDMDAIISIIKQGIVKERQALNPSVIVMGMSYLGYMTEKEFYS